MASQVTLIDPDGKVLDARTFPELPKPGDIIHLEESTWEVQDRPRTFVFGKVGKAVNTCTFSMEVAPVGTMAKHAAISRKAGSPRTQVQEQQPE
jgi:hypothetical protein